MRLKTGLSEYDNVLKGLKYCKWIDFSQNRYIDPADRLALGGVRVKTWQADIFKVYRTCPSSCGSKNCRPERRKEC
jgi:hypothetical protein